MTIDCNYVFVFYFRNMAKGKHAPAKGAVREDKVLHPKSRKVAKLHNKEQRKLKLSGKVSVGGQRLQILGEKLLWFQDNLQMYVDDDKKCISANELVDLIQAYIERNESELEQIKLKNSIGSGQFKKRNQYTSRQDQIELAKKTETEEFNGCGFEIPDLLNEDNFKKFIDWNGELRFVQNLKLKRFTKSFLCSFSEAKSSEEDVDINME